MTYRILTQSIVIIKPKLRDTAHAAGITATDIKKAIPVFRAAIDLPAADYEIADKPSHWMILFGVISATLAAFGGAMLYLVDGTGNALESLINKVSDIMPAIQRMAIDGVAWLAAPMFDGWCYVA